MAILINKPITYKGINLTNIYLRFKFNSDLEGKEISTMVYIFTDKISFNDDPNFNNLDIINLSQYLTFPYDRMIDGTDILLFIHNKVVEQLTMDIIKTNIDPDTGIETTIISQEKFCEESEISIVDID